MVGDGEAARLPRLGHRVRDVDDGAVEGCQRPADPAAQERRDGAREEAPGPEHEHVRLLYGLDHARRGRHALGLDGDARDPLADTLHHGLAAGNGTVGVAHHERQALGGGRKDGALDAQEPRRLLDALAEAAGHVREGRDDDVADAVVVEVTRRLEAVVEDLGETFAPRERDQAVPDVPGRGDAELLAEPAARPAVVGDRHDGRQVTHPVAQPAQQDRQPGTPAERDHPEILHPTHRRPVYRLPTASPSLRASPGRGAPRSPGPGLWARCG